MDSSSRDYFLKLPATFDPSLLDIDYSGWQLKGRYTHPTKYGVALGREADYRPVPPELYIVEGKTRQQILSWLPKELTVLENPEIVFIYVPPHESGVGMFAPHVDGFRIACINFYVDAADEVTTFYDYTAGKLSSRAAFSAKAGECWILNPTVPHSVTISAAKPRKVVSVSFATTSYARLVDILATAGKENV